MNKQVSDLYNLDKAHNLKHLGFPTKVHALVECDVCGQNHRSFILSKLVEHHSGRVIAQALQDRFPICAERSALFPSNRSIDTYRTKYMQKDTDLRGVPVIDTAIQEVRSKWHGIAEGINQFFELDQRLKHAQELERQAGGVPCQMVTDLFMHRFTMWERIQNMLIKIGVEPQKQLEVTNNVQVSVSNKSFDEDKLAQKVIGMAVEAGLLTPRGV